jgi:hypothetical protein
VERLLPALFKLNYKPLDRAGKTRLLALCWTGFILVFFTFSTTQEYYSMPCYPALALLLGSAMAAGGNWIRYGTRVLCGIFIAAAATVLTLYFLAWNLPTPGDIPRRSAPIRAPTSFARPHGRSHHRFVRLSSASRSLWPRSRFWWERPARFAPPGSAPSSPSLMAILFFQAARIAMAAFDPFSPRGRSRKLLRSPAGKLIVDHHYYWFSSVFFYTNRDALLLNGRFNNLVYGSYAPGAPNVFIDDAQWKTLWLQPERYYLVIKQESAERLKKLVDPKLLTVVAQSGGKLLLTNHPVVE